MEPKAQDDLDGSQPKDLDFFDGESEKELNNWPGAPREGGLIGFSFNPDEAWKGIFDALNNPEERAKYNRERELFDQGKKHGNKEAAQKFYDLLQLDEKIKELKALLPNPEQAVFISQPSTTRDNIIPAVIAKNLANKLGGESFAGEEFFTAAHKKQIKKMKGYERLLYPREYEAKFEHGSLTQMIGDRMVFVVEDRVNTGGSVKAFIQGLREQGVNVKGLIVLKGDPFIEPEPKVINFLKDALREKRLSFNAEQIAKKLTQREVATLAININKMRFGNDIQRQKLTGEIQRLLDQGTP